MGKERGRQGRLRHAPMGTLAGEGRCASLSGRMAEGPRPAHGLVGNLTSRRKEKCSAGRLEGLASNQGGVSLFELN